MIIKHFQILNFIFILEENLFSENCKTVGHVQIILLHVFIKLIKNIITLLKKSLDS